MANAFSPQGGAQGAAGATGPAGATGATGATGPGIAGYQARVLCILPGGNLQTVVASGTFSAESVTGAPPFGSLRMGDVTAMTAAAGGAAQARSAQFSCARSSGYEVGALTHYTRGVGSCFAGLSGQFGNNVAWDSAVNIERIGLAAGATGNKLLWVTCDGLGASIVDLTSFSADFAADGPSALFWSWMRASAADTTKVLWRVVNLLTGADTGVQQATTRLTSSPLQNGFGGSNGATVRYMGQQGIAGVP